MGSMPNWLVADQGRVNTRPGIKVARSSFDELCSGYVLCKYSVLYKEYNAVPVLAEGYLTLPMHLDIWPFPVDMLNRL